MVKDSLSRTQMATFTLETTLITKQYQFSLCLNSKYKLGTTPKEILSGQEACEVLNFFSAVNNNIMISCFNNPPSVYYIDNTNVIQLASNDAFCANNTVASALCADILAAPVELEASDHENWFFPKIVAFMKEQSDGMANFVAYQKLDTDEMVYGFDKEERPARRKTEKIEGGFIKPLLEDCVLEKTLWRPEADSNNSTYTEMPEGTRFFFRIGECIYQIQSSCSPDKDIQLYFRTTVNGGNTIKTYECKSACEFYLLESNPKVCVILCPEEERFTTPDGRCVSRCPEEAPYGVGNDCKPVCPEEQSYYTFTDGMPICRPACIGDATIIPPTLPLDYTIENLNALTGPMECTPSCSGAVVLSWSLYESENKRRPFCVPFCPFMHSEKSNSCVLECKDDFKYLANGNECVSDCAAEGFNYFTEEFACTNECSMLIDHNIACVSKCPDNRPFAVEGHCIERCPSSAPFLLNYSECVSQCPSIFYEWFCVDKCDETALKVYMASYGMVFADRPFVLTTKECFTSCKEPSAPYINEATLECMTECPQPCEGALCDEDIKYKDEVFYCRKNCSTAVYPYKDKETLQCLTNCPEERPFFLIEPKECMEECKTSTVVRHFNCPHSPDECEDSSLECVDACPEELKYTFPGVNYSECVSVCPKFYEPDSKNVCLLSCKPDEGYIENEEKTSCLHCHYDLNKKFLHNGKCVTNCPLLTTSDAFSVCRKCFDLRLWTNQFDKCVPFIFCDKDSVFDYSVKTCIPCTDPGYMLVVKEGETARCVLDDCLKGVEVNKETYKECFYCNEDRFFSEEECLNECPEGKAYELNKFTCQESCLTSCTTRCCQNGTCSKGKCECKEGFLGSRCDISTDMVEEVKANLVKFLNSLVSKPKIYLNQIEAIQDFTACFEHLSKKRKLNEIDTARNILNNLISFANSLYIEGEYQKELFMLLDKLMVLSIAYYDVAENLSFFEQTLKMVDMFSENVFTTESELTRQVFSFYFKGKSFNLRLGNDILKNSKIDLKTCVWDIKLALKLAPTSSLAFKHIDFTEISSSLVKREFKEALSLEAILKEEVFLFFNNSLINVNEFCSPKFIDSSFELVFEDKQAEETFQRFSKIGVNVFNTQEDFFNDRCAPFTDSDGKDRTLAERQSNFYLDAKILCKETEYQVCSIKQEENKQICDCKGIGNDRKASLQSVFSSYPKNNAILVLCWNVFKQTDLLENETLYLLVLPFLVCLVVSFVYAVKVEPEVFSEAKFKYIKENVELFQADKMNKLVFFEECANLKKNLYMLRPEECWEEKPEILAQFKAVPTMLDLNHLDATETLKYDTRSIIRYAMDNIAFYHVLLAPFFSLSLSTPIIYPLMFIFTKISLEIGFNALFIDDSLVENRNAASSEGIIETLQKELPKTIWALVTAKAVHSFIKMFYKFDQVKVDKLRERLSSAKSKLMMQGYDSYMNKQRWSMILFVFFATVINFCSFYFLIVYTEIYRNSKGIWIDGVLFGIIVNYLFAQMAIPFLLIGARIFAKYTEIGIKVYNLVLKLSRKMKVRR